MPASASRTLGGGGSLPLTPHQRRRFHRRKPIFLHGPQGVPAARFLEKAGWKFKRAAKLGKGTHGHFVPPGYHVLPSGDEPHGATKSSTKGSSMPIEQTRRVNIRRNLRERSPRNGLTRGQKRQFQRAWARGDENPPQIQSTRELRGWNYYKGQFSGKYGQSSNRPPVGGREYSPYNPSIQRSGRVQIPIRAVRPSGNERVQLPAFRPIAGPSGRPVKGQRVEGREARGTRGRPRISPRQEAGSAGRLPGPSRTINRPGGMALERAGPYPRARYLKAQGSRYLGGGGKEPTRIVGRMKKMTRKEPSYIRRRFRKLTPAR